MSRAGAVEKRSAGISGRGMAAGVEDLVGRLARELDSEWERREFTQRCQAIRPRTS